MSNTSKQDALLRELSNLWRNEVFRIVFLLMVVVLGHFILQAALVVILKTEYPLHTPISGSMEPTLRVGDLLIIRGGLTASDIHANPGNGDIIIFRDPRNPSGIPIVHRVIRKLQEGGKWYFITKGDANSYDDYTLWGWKIPEESVLGKVIVSIPFLGYFLRFLDETQIYVGGYSITLRMVIILLLIASIFLLEFIGPSERTEEPQEKGEADKEKRNSQE